MNIKKKIKKNKIKIKTQILRNAKIPKKSQRKMHENM